MSNRYYRYILIACLTAGLLMLVLNQLVIITM